VSNRRWVVRIIRRLLMGYIECLLMQSWRGRRFWENSEAPIALSFVSHASLPFLVWLPPKNVDASLSFRDGSRLPMVRWRGCVQPASRTFPSPKLNQKMPGSSPKIGLWLLFWGYWWLISTNYWNSSGTQSRQSSPSPRSDSRSFWSACGVVTPFFSTQFIIIRGG